MYERIEKEATRLHLDVDTYLSTVLMREAGRERQQSSHENETSKEISGIGLFADSPEVMDKIVADAMATRSEPWRLPDVEIPESIKEEVNRRIKEAGSPGKALLGLFSDVPELVDAVLDDIMASRARRWQRLDEKSPS